MDNNISQPLRPKRYVEHILVTSILSGTYPPGSLLPNERALANQIGVTRPTVRETLQRLENEGWVKIRHGKPTVVNDYWRKGGLSLLGTLAKYSEYLPNVFSVHLLEVRVTLLPPITRLAATHHPKIVLEYLGGAQDLPQDAEHYAAYDWKLQMLVARHSNNPIFPLIFNDFSLIFNTMARRYFKLEKARRASCVYYRELFHAVELGAGTVEKVVMDAMQESITIWLELMAIKADLRPPKPAQWRNK